MFVYHPWRHYLAGSGGSIDSTLSTDPLFSNTPEVLNLLTPWKWNRKRRGLPTRWKRKLNPRECNVSKGSCIGSSFVQVTGEFKWKTFLVVPIQYLKIHLISSTVKVSLVTEATIVRSIKSSQKKRNINSLFCWSIH